LPTLELTRDEIVAEMERVAQARQGVSAAELVAAYRDGTLQDPGAIGDVLVLAGLLDPDDPYFAG
jgi:hypothetical protein